MFFGALHHLAVGEALLQRAHVIDHQLTAEVVVFVLDGDREEALGLELEGLAVAILSAHADLRGAIDVFLHAREGGR